MDLDFKDMTPNEKADFLERAMNREIARLDKKISDLEAEIAFLKRLLNPSG